METRKQRKARKDFEKRIRTTLKGLHKNNAVRSNVAVINHAIKICNNELILNRVPVLPRNVKHWLVTIKNTLEKQGGYSKKVEKLLNEYSYV